MLQDLTIHYRRRRFMQFNGARLKNSSLTTPNLASSRLDAVTHVAAAVEEHVYASI
jgi:hypothetical protein